MARGGEVSTYCNRDTALFKSVRELRTADVGSLIDALVVA